MSTEEFGRTNVMLLDLIHNFLAYLNLFKKGIRQEHNWEIKHGNIFHSNGLIFEPQHTSFSVKLSFILS